MKKVVLVAACAVGILFLSSNTLIAQTTHYVPYDPNCNTIQRCINSASPGDEIRVYSPYGTFYESIDFLGKDLRLMTYTGAVIEATSAGPVVTFENGEGPNALLQGFTITGGTPRTEAVSTATTRRPPS